MKILGAVGLALTIIVLKFLTPAVYRGLEDTLLAFFSTLQGIMALDPNLMTASAPGVSGI